MRYALMIYSDEADGPKPPTRAFESMMDEYFALTDEARAQGVHSASEALEPVATATTVRVRDGKTLTADGPFAETKEQLRGFYLLDFENLDEALDFAARIPSARFGCVEVRPVVDFGSTR